jgi:hypothetical protein
MQGAGGGVGGAGYGAEIIPQSYNAAAGGAAPPGNVAGVTAPEYGMTYTGTPIGLPGPPHLPYGHPAGLCYHAMHNHTHHKIPPPVNHFNVHVKQEPGFRYPPPASSVHINETAYPCPPQQIPCDDCPPAHLPYPLPY